MRALLLCGVIATLAWPASGLARPLYSCAGLKLHAGDVARLPHLDAHDAASRAFIAFLRSPSAGLPRNGWRVYTRTVRSADFIRLFPTRPEGSAARFVMRRGRWHVESWGDCTAKRVVRGFEVVKWRSARQQDPSQTRLTIWAETAACYPGSRRSLHAERRFDHARFRYTRHALYVLVLFRPERAPRHGCAGVGLEVRMTLHLPRPLGRHVLYDASTLPATPARR